MAGHSKWSKVKHKKAAEDKKKSRLFSALTRTITLEAKAAGGDTASPGLRKAVENARAQNMPNENIERAVLRGRGTGTQEIHDVLYEAYGPGGTAIIITGLTDNKNRTSQEIKHIMSRHNATLANPGAASWAFQKEKGEWKPVNTIPVSEEDASPLSSLIQELEEHDDVSSVVSNATL